MSSDGGRLKGLSREQRLYISLAVTVSIVLISFTIIFFGVYQVYFAPASLFRRDYAAAGPVESHFGGRAVNVLLLGLHNRNDDNTFGDVYFVDTILVASINFDRNSVDVLSIPRDSHVPISGLDDMDRVRQAYSYGHGRAEEDRHAAGLTCALETITSLLEGVELHYYVAMDIEGLRQLIDSLGGVYYTVERPMVGFTPQESLSPGPQQLDGRGYVNYLTYREPDARDDLNRIARQKKMLLATFDYFQEMGIFRYVIPAYAAYRSSVLTDLSFNQVAALALFAGERLEAEAIRTFSLRGEYFSPDQGATYFLRLDEAEKEELIGELFGRGKTTAAARAAR